MSAVTTTPLKPGENASCCNSTNIVVGGLGLSLAVFFGGATAAVAVGAVPPPTAMWAAGGAVSGALVGLLAPAPGTKSRHLAAAKVAEKHAEDAHKAGAADVAERASAEARDHNMAAATTPETKGATILLAIAFVLLLLTGIVLAGGAISPPGEFKESFQNVITAIVALASAAGTALIGILSPGKGS